MPTCSQCQRQLPEDAFHWSRHHDHPKRTTRCKPCHASHQAEVRRNAAAKREAASYQCSVCQQTLPFTAFPLNGRGRSVHTCLTCIADISRSHHHNIPHIMPAAAPAPPAAVPLWRWRILRLHRPTRRALPYHEYDSLMTALAACERLNLQPDVAAGAIEYYVTEA